MISVIRVRFDTNNDANSVWSDELVRNWMQPLIPYSLGDFWWSSSWAIFSVEHTLYDPIVMTDPRLSARECCSTGRSRTRRNRRGN